MTPAAASANDSWRSRVLSHVGGPTTFKKIGKDAGIAAVFAIGGWMTSDDGPMKDASPNTKRLVNLAFGAPMLAKLNLPELQKTWKEREIPDFVMHGLTTAIATLGISTNDRDMINSAAMLATLFSMAGHLEEGVQGKSQEGIKTLEKLVPGTATLHKSGKNVPIEQVKVKQLVRVAHGETIPVDGVVKEILVKGKPESIGAVRMPQLHDGEGGQVRVRLGEPVPQGAVAAEGTPLVVKAKAVAADSSISRNISYLSEAEGAVGTSHSVSSGIKHIYVPIMLAACAGEFAWSYYKHKKKHEQAELIDGKSAEPSKEIKVEKWISEKLGWGKKAKKDTEAAEGKKDEKDDKDEKKKEDEHRPRTEVDHLRKSIKRTAELAIKMAPCAIMASLLVIPFVKNALAARHGVM
ncbi:MAG: hypothetical protein K2Q01_03330, partial [Rickettsiales bacterium]|nr:hypothetical protein [Rickettsiales bacterium]